MADQAIPAVSTTPATTVVAAIPTTPTLAPDATTAQPIQDPVAASEQARLAAQGLQGVVQSPQAWRWSLVAGASSTGELDIRGLVDNGEITLDYQCYRQPHISVYLRN